MRVLPKQFEKYGLTLHPEKTRLIEFGRHVSEECEEAGKTTRELRFPWIQAPLRP